MFRAVLLAILCALWLAPAAFAGTARIAGIPTASRYDPTVPALVYTAAAGERNQIAVARTGGTGTGLDPAVALRDTGADVLAGPGCTAIDARTVSCRVAHVVVNAGDGDDTVTLTEPARGFAITELRGGDGADALTGSGTLAGGPGRDVLTGGPHRSVLLGGTGDDVLRGGAANDVLVGDADAYLYAAPDPGGGDDVIDGGEGRDVALYSGRRRGVRVDLGAGTAGSGGERDRLDGIEDVTGGRGSDVLRGDRGRNLLEGHPGDDRLDGRGGNDVLAGGHGADTLRGGDGNDRLNARERGDRLFGGAGDDRLTASTARRPARSSGAMRGTIWSRETPAASGSTAASAWSTCRACRSRSGPCGRVAATCAFTGVAAAPRRAVTWR